MSLLIQFILGNLSGALACFLLTRGVRAWCKVRGRRSKETAIAHFAREINRFKDGAHGFFFVEEAVANAVERDATQMGLRVRFERRTGCRQVRVVVHP